VTGCFYIVFGDFCQFCMILWYWWYFLYINVVVHIVFVCLHAAVDSKVILSHSLALAFFTASFTFELLCVYIFVFEPSVTEIFIKLFAFRFHSLLQPINISGLIIKMGIFIKNYSIVFQRILRRDLYTFACAQTNCQCIFSISSKTARKHDF